MKQLRGFTILQNGLSSWLVFLLVFDLLGTQLLNPLFSPTSAEAAVVTIDTTSSTNARTNNNTGTQTVFVTDQIGYSFYRDSTGQCVYRKSTDAGATWGTTVLVDSQTDCIRIGVWYDKWTPGDAGVNIHIVTMDTSDDDLFYNRLDTTTDTLLSGAAPTNISSNSLQVPTFSASINTLAFTKATDGTLYAAANDNSDSYAVSCSATCNNVANWNEVGVSPFDLRNDHTILMPLAGGDVMAINRDISANLIRSKIWNGVSWSASWSNVDTSVSESAEYDGGMSATIDQSTGYIYLIYAADNDILTDDNDDVQSAVYDGSAWTTMSDAITNQVGRGLLDVAVAIDQNNGHVYAAYAIQDTAGDVSTANIYYKQSTDGMTSWGSEIGPVNASPGDIRKPALDPSNFERLYVTWWEAATDDRFGETLDNIGPDIKVSATGTQAAVVKANTSDNYAGGTFVIESLVPNTLSSLTLTETGTLDANAGIENVKVFYDLDTTSPYDCDSETYAGGELQFGATDSDGFSSANGTSTFSGAAVVLNPTTTFCGYVVFDATNMAADGSTFDLQIADPLIDIGITGTDPFPDAPVALAGSTTIVSPDVTLTHYHWRNDDGLESAATSATGGAEDTSIDALQILSPKRLRLGVSVEGSTTSDPMAYQLEFAVAGATCELSSGWSAIDTVGDEFEMFDSVNLTDGTDTTNIAVAIGGVTDENVSFLTPNAATKDISDTVAATTMTVTQFLELEYSIQATALAVEGTTYCFRLTDNGVELGVYDVYPQVTINADITASSTGALIATVDTDVSSIYLGGQFILSSNVGSHTLTSLAISEFGSIDATSGLTNIKLFYDLDTTAPYDCQSETYEGTELQFGATDTDGFDAVDGQSVFADSATLNTTQAACFYVVADVTDLAFNGDTIAIAINSPTADVLAGGASISPSSLVAITGSSTVYSSVVVQSGYHWRDDNDSETAATSATGGLESTPEIDFAIDTPIRLRLSLANTGATSTLDVGYTLQYAELVSSCVAASGWTDVDALDDDDWDQADSLFLTHGDATTNIAVPDGGITDPATTFVGIDGVRESDSLVASTTLAGDSFLEIEFSLKSTLATTYGGTYCFRLSNLDGSEIDDYQTYPQITVASKRDFKVQRGNAVMTGGTYTITAGTDYTAPSSAGLAFVRITNTNHTGAGDVVGGGSQDVEEITAYIQDPENITTSITFARDRILNETFIDWEIVEFIGQPGTDNEMLVQSSDTVTMSTVQSTISGPVVSVSDDSDVVVFVTGVSGNDTANDLFATQVTAEWDAATGVPVFTRGATGGSDLDISYAVVEFSGMNWQVQRVEHTYVATSTPETETITPVTSMAQTFIHAQKRVGANVEVASHGHEVWLSSVGAVSFELPAGADLSVEQVSVAWVIENIQTGIGAMQVERQAASTRNGSEPATISVGISDTLDEVGNSSIFGNSSADGTNAAHPRSIAGLRIVSPTSYELWRSDTGTNLYYRVELVQWPVADLSYRQNYYRFYSDNDLLTPSDPWPSGGDDLGENTSITGVDDPPGAGDLLRLRMTVQARNANWPADFVQFKLQYSKRITTCTAAVGWFDVGDTSSSTLWRGYAAPGTTDGTVLSGDPPTPGDLLISVADVAGSLEHENNTATNTYIAFDGEDVEYDWYLEHNEAEADTVYCFRMVEADGSGLSGYLQYPQIRTADFSPVLADWQWYDDSQNETPSSAIASVNTAPSDLAASSTVALRVVVPEVKGVPELDVKFKLQFSEDPSFTVASDVVASSSCVYSSVWCYVDGPTADNATITTATIGTSDSCVAGSGAGCGTHNTSPDYVAGHPHDSGAAQEYSFILKNTLLRPNVVYYFRLFDVTKAKPVEPSGVATYPSIQAEGAGLIFTISGLPNGTSTADLITGATTTASEINFGNLPVNSDVAAAQRLSVDTNAAEGYRVWKFARQNLTNASGLEIAPITSTNASPNGWSSSCVLGVSGCVGYHTTDATLDGGSARFAPLDTYAALHVTPQEIMYSSLPADESHDIVYRIFVTEDQPAGLYETDIVYIATPIY